MWEPRRKNRAIAARREVMITIERVRRIMAFFYI
jgi:hypothetical protein